MLTGVHSPRGPSPPCWPATLLTAADLCSPRLVLEFFPSIVHIQSPVLLPLVVSSDILALGTD